MSFLRRVCTVSLGLAALSGCTGKLPGPPEWNRDVVPPADSVAEAQRLACAYKAGSLPAETQGASHPSGPDIPIDHIVVVMMENRSFDHFFQKLPDGGQPDVEVAPAGYTNPDENGQPVGLTRDTQLCFVDTNHEWNGVHQQYDGGKMDGFYLTNQGHGEGPAPDPSLLSGRRALTYYTGDDLPFMYWAANEFAIGDHYHCSVLGPTWPNRLYLYGASSYGKTSNVFPMNVPGTLFDEMTQRKLPWVVYKTSLPGYYLFPDNIGRYAGTDHEKMVDDFFTDAAAGKLPPVAFVDPDLANENAAGNDDHPPGMMITGENFLAKVTQALLKSPEWSRTALFITFDEHGGLYDHVVPPAACPPDDGTTPQLGAGDAQADFNQYGIRVPFIVISPYAKHHFVGHRTYDHTSIVRFIEARWVMPAMTGRDANAEAPWEFFDFQNPPHATAPMNLTVPEVPMNDLQRCKTLYGVQ